MVQRPSVEQLSDSQAGVSRAVARRLVEAGHQAWLVGGCVRDLALGRIPGDLDVTTDATPDRIEALFERTVDVGRDFGTIVVADFGTGVEVTTFRADGSYGDGRRPDAVRFSATVAEDAARRDFTCNALYLDPLSDELADPTGGFDDLGAALLRAIGDARERFTEDSLRVLRLVRFAATHDLRIDEATWAAAAQTAELVARVARERVLSELTRTFDRGDLAHALDLLGDLGLAGPALGIVGRDVCGADEKSIARSLGRGAGADVGFALTLAGAAIGGDVREHAVELLRGLRPSRELVRSVDGLLHACELLLGNASDADLVRARDTVRLDAWTAYVRAFADAGRCFDGTHVERLDGLLERWPDERGLPAPLLDARALQELGVERGPRLGALLHALVDAQITERVTTGDEAEAFVRARLER